MMLIAIAVASVAPGPALRVAPDRDGRAMVVALDRRGTVAARIACLGNQWVNPADTVAKLLASPEVAASLVETNGRLTELDQLGPARFDCVILPPEGSK